MDPSNFLSALLAIVIIDLVLAGDNAIVIALAARGLPSHLQKRAIIWGAVGAIAVRSVMTVIVVWLLKIPGLLLVGGALLVWIGYHLLLPEKDEGNGHSPRVTTFWAAMRTIVVADAVMGLDNVLAVAGAAHGSYLLVVIGLLISIPIVVWGSSLVLKVVDRYPAVVYLGSGVLLWTAVTMMSSEPLLKPWLAAVPQAKWMAYIIIPAVLWAGFVKNHRQLESRIHARLAQFKLQNPLGASTAPADSTDSYSQATPASVPSPRPQPEGEPSMLKVLVPVDGSSNSLMAVKHVIQEYQRHHELELHLLNVQPRMSRHIGRFVSRHDRQAWHEAQAKQAMASAQATLTQAGVPFHSHWRMGARSPEICAAATELGAHHIVMGTARKNSITRMLEDSVTNQVLEATPIPVEVIPGTAVSKWERWGLPAGVLGLGGLAIYALQ